jgi:tRNA-dihydrouridine synthase B
MEQVIPAANAMCLQIGSISLSLPVVQAALSGYSDWPMRTIARQGGAPYTIHEVMIDTFVNSLKPRHRTRRFLMVTDRDHPVGAQLMGSDPQEFAPAAGKLVAAGFDVIDINFGCPMKKVRNRCRGGLHLGQPEVAIEILNRVRDAVPEKTPVTVKMRRGVDDSQESRDNFFSILDAAATIPLDAVTVHARTVQQKYVGSSSWQFLKEVRTAYPTLTLLGSGDLFSALDCVRMIRETGVDGVTAARGAIGNPWIFSNAAALLRGLPLPPPPTLHQQRDVLEQHFRLTEEVYPSGTAARQMRKFGIHYARLHPNTIMVRQAFIQATDADAWHAVLKDHYHTDHAGIDRVHEDNSGP